MNVSLFIEKAKDTFMHPWLFIKLIDFY